MREIKEIPPYTPEQQGYRPVEGQACPSCGNRLYYGSVRCPDGLPGCCVAHFGYICWTCGKQFQ